jgi:hypothetical protein
MSEKESKIVTQEIVENDETNEDSDLDNEYQTEGQYRRLYARTQRRN